MKSHKPDYIFLSFLIIILLFGLISLLSASIIKSYQIHQTLYYFFKHQFLFGILLGLLAFFIFQKIDYKFWIKISPVLFLFSLILLILVLFPSIGCKVNGAQRWICILGFSLQPSEILKLSLILFLSSWFSRKPKGELADFRKTFLPFIIMISIMSFLIILEPDIGTLGLLIIISLAIYFTAGAKFSHIFLLLITGTGLLAILIKTAPYRFNRLLSFLNPDLDPQGIGYQIKQALISIGSGGLFGVGLGQSQQKQAILPMPLHDSIFAVIGEEFGFIGTLFLLICFIVLLWQGVKIIKKAPCDSARLTALGIIVWITAQTFINILGIIGLMPLTGIPLPFVSYGSSSLIISLAGAGILFNISKHTV